MKKVCIILIVGMLIVFAGCEGKEEEASSVPPPSIPEVETTPTPEPLVKIAVVNNAADGLNVRAEPSSDGKVLEIAQNGDKFILQKEEKVNDFYEISFENRTAYISADYSSISEISSAEAQALKSPAAGTASATPVPTESSEKTDSEDGSESSKEEDSANPTPTPVPATPKPVSSAPKTNDDGEQ